MHVYYIMIKSSQKFWVVYVRYRFIPEQCDAHRCVLIEISMEIGMLIFWLGLLVTALMKETYFTTWISSFATYFNNNELKCEI